MEAAWAAEISDPERHRWFRRRWHEPMDEPTAPVEAEHVITLSGQKLLRQWRRERGQWRGDTP
jgi:hypothetical protein